MKTRKELRDGPVANSDCYRCGEHFEYDIYRYHGEILCGDCRYYVRTGREAKHERRAGCGSHTSGIIEAKLIAYHGEGSELRLPPSEMLGDS